MIWLSPMAGTEEGSVYFEIRDIAWQQTATGTDGLICGLLGDGQREIWGEVQLGTNSQARIVPLWTDEGQVESLSAAVDEDLLKAQLLEAVEKLFATIHFWSVPNGSIGGNQTLTKHNQQSDWLAA